jgi:hypothetical protein
MNLPAYVSSTLSGIVSSYFCNYVALPWHTDVRVNLHVSSAANNGFLESDVIMGMPSWALQYILALLFSTVNLCFSSMVIWRFDDPAIIEKYGNYKWTADDLAAAACTSPPTCQSQIFGVGDEVELHGLSSEAGRLINGLLAIVVEAGSKRCIVQFNAAVKGGIRRQAHVQLRFMREPQGKGKGKGKRKGKGKDTSLLHAMRIMLLFALLLLCELLVIKSAHS